MRLGKSLPRRGRNSVGNRRPWVFGSEQAFGAENALPLLVQRLRELGWISSMAKGREQTKTTGYQNSS